MIFSPEKLKTIKHHRDTLEMVYLCVRKYRQTGNRKYLETAKEFGALSLNIKDFLNEDDFSVLDEGRTLVDTLSGSQK